MKIIAHRGASAERPENTLAAFRRALEIGVDAVEADVLVTKDGRLVVRHDDLVPYRGDERRVSELSFAELRTIDAGGGERIPSLEELLDCVGGRAAVFLDLKDYGVARHLAPVLADRGTRGIHVTSFLHEEIAEIGGLLRNVERSVVFAAVPLDFEHFIRPVGVREVSLFRGYLREELVRAFTSRGVRVRAYPVNLFREAVTFASWGVEAIFTDDPAAMRSLCSATPS